MPSGSSRSRSLRLFASPRSAGTRLPFRDAEIAVEDAATADYAGLDIVFFSAGGSTSRALAPRVAAAGAIVIDNSSAWRGDAEVPLVVAEVNPHALRSIPKGIVANPNCTTMAAMPALKPLHDAAGLKRLVASTYQAVSGGGVEGVEVLRAQIAAAGADCAALARDGSAVDLGEPRKWAVPIGFNVVPFNYVLAEGRVYRGGTEAARRDPENPRDPRPAGGRDLRPRAGVHRAFAVAQRRVRAAAPAEEAMRLLREAPGVELADVPNPLAATGRDPVFVGRVRRDPTVAHGLALFVVGDNLRKGAALNAVQIAEVLIAPRE